MKPFHRPMLFRLPGADKGAPDSVVAVNTPRREALLAQADQRLRAGEGFAIATINLDHLVKLSRPGDFRAAYAAQTWVVADGNPIVWLSRLARRPVELVTGSDLVIPLAGVAAEAGAPIALLGADEITLERAGEALKRLHPQLKIAAAIAPPFGLDPKGEVIDGCLAQVEASGAKLCFLALGAPKQEIIAARGLERTSGVGFVSVGAGIEFVAGTQTRAPRWVRALALEWVWRLAMQPRRLLGRYLSCIAILPRLTADALRLRGETNAPEGS